jgi:uncharacterized membrane protein
MRKLNTKINLKKRLILNLGIVLFFSFLVTLPIFFEGIPGGNDMNQHFQFAQTFYDSINEGNYYPSWATQPNYGYGDVSVRFYPPLTYYILSFFRAILGNWFDGSCIAFAFLFFISGIGVYFWSREWFSENASLVGALAYIISPYHTNQIFRASLIAEFTAAAIIPFCFLFTTRVCRKGSPADICALGLSFGLLILTHLPTTIMASLLLLVYALFSINRTDCFKQLIKLSLGVFVGLLLSSFYWIRMITELDLVKHNNETFRIDSFSYQAHFVFARLFPLDGIKTATTSSSLDTLLLVMLGILVPNTVLYLINVKKKNIYPLTNVLTITFLALLMTTPISKFIWDYFVVLQKIQFPFRWLIFVSVGSSIIVAAVFSIVVEYFRTSQRAISLLSVGFMLVCLFYNILVIGNHYFYYPKEYFNSVVARFETGVSCECWWTVWTKQSVADPRRPERLSDKVIVNERPVKIAKWSSVERIFTIDPGETGQVTVATLYYPHWKVSINGHAMEVLPDENGFISFVTPKEKSHITLFFEEPFISQTALKISIISWAIVLLFLFTKLFSNYFIPKETIFKDE